MCEFVRACVSEGQIGFLGILPHLALPQTKCAVLQSFVDEPSVPDPSGDPEKIFKEGR